MENAWAVNNKLAHKPSSMQEATQRVVHIIDAKYEKADLHQLLAPTVLTIVFKTKISYWSYS
jgi:hypothetical protein